MKRAYKSLKVSRGKRKEASSIRPLEVNMNRMKKALLFFILILLAGCELYIYEEPVPWDDRDYFIGEYRVEEFSETTGSIYNYDIRIRKAWNNNREIKIKNFYGIGLNVIAIVDGNRLTIPLQEEDGYEIEGTGRVYGDKLVLTFMARDLYELPTYTDFVSAEGWLY